MLELEHPDITRTLLTGYPHREKPKPFYCEACEVKIDDEDDVYEDELHECICKRCLLEHHRKRW